MKQPDLSTLISLFAMPKAVILAVDDMPQNLRLLRTVFAAVGCKVVEAESAAAARQHLTTMRPDIILLDVVMPGTDGLTLCQELKANPQYTDIPVIFLSGQSDAMDKLKAFSVGGADYVSKPFEPAEVLARVNHHYKMLRMRQALQSEKELLSKMNAELLVARQETADVFGIMADQLRGKVLDGKYLLEDKIGFGGCAVVYRARQLALQKMVAIKVMRPANPQRAAVRLHRFRQEVISAARIRHRNVTTVFDATTSSDGITYLVMELLDGHPLSDELRPHQPLPLSRCIQILYPVCEVLAEAHAVNVLHRDIKPANIFLHHEAGEEIVKVLDFGIAKLTDDSAAMDTGVTLPGEVVGTVYYMSPEQILGDPCDGRTDVYSLGVTLYEMLTGQVPFPALGQSSIGTWISHLSVPPPPPSLHNPLIPPQIDEVVLSVLSKDPAKRPDIVEFAERMLEVCRELLGDDAVDALLLPAKV